MKRKRRSTARRFKRCLRHHLRGKKEGDVWAATKKIAHTASVAVMVTQAFAMAIEALSSNVAATSQLRSRLQLYFPK